MPKHTPDPARDELAAIVEVLHPTVPARIRAGALIGAFMIGVTALAVIVASNDPSTRRPEPQPAAPSLTVAPTADLSPAERAALLP